MAGLWDRLTGGDPVEERYGPLVGLTCEDALDALATYMTQEGAIVTDRDENRLYLKYHKGPDGGLLILLLLLAILPGILYWMAASRDVSFTITATPSEGGCRLLYGGERRADYDAFRKWLKKEAPEPDPSITLDQQTRLSQRGEEHADIPAQIRRLAELRDAGAITKEDFEAKKRDLLDRM